MTTQAKALETPRIIRPSDWEMLRKVRDKHVPKQDAYARAFLSELAAKLESEAGMELSAPSAPSTCSAPRQSSDTFLELAAEIVDPAEWVALQMTKLPVTPGMTRGEAMDMVKAIVREGFDMLKRHEAHNKESR